MKKLFLLMIACVSMTSHAQYNELKIQTIEDMYEIARDREVGSLDIFLNYANESFSDALALESSVYSAGYVCGTGGDDLWLSQDVDFSTPVTYEIDEYGFIRAKVGNNGVVTYKMECTTYECTIDDAYVEVIDEKPLSVKRNILNTCEL